jgi:hypothetical protein
MYHFIIPWDIVFTALFKASQVMARFHCLYGYLIFLSLVDCCQMQNKVLHFVKINSEMFS